MSALSCNLVRHSYSFACMERTVYVAGEVKASSENPLSLCLLLRAFPSERGFFVMVDFFQCNSCLGTLARRFKSISLPPGAILVMVYECIELQSCSL